MMRLIIWWSTKNINQTFKDILIIALINNYNIYSLFKNLIIYAHLFLIPEVINYY